MVLYGRHRPRADEVNVACLLQCMSPILARYGPDPAETPGPLSGVLRPRLWKSGAAASDPHVWSGRALQEVFVDLAALRSCINVSGL